MNYDFVAFHEIAEEVAKNLGKHYSDVKLKEDYGAPNLDWDSYLALSHSGNCYAVTARLDGGSLVAYSVFIVNKNINHKTVVDALSCGIFIDEKYRGKITTELLRKSDEFLKKIGVHETMYFTNDKRIGALLRRVKYKPKQVAWAIKY